MLLPASISIVSALLGFFIAHRGVGKSRVVVRAVLFLVFAAFAIPAVLSAVYYLHVLPETAWFYTLRSWAWTDAAAVFLGAAGGAVATLLPRWLLIFPLTGVMGIATVPYLKAFINPLNQSILRDHWEKDAALQSTASTCGPASTASILRWLGKPASETEIARAAHTTGSGTEAWYLARYLRSRGLKTRFHFHSGLDQAGAFPAIVGVRIGNFGHFIAVLEIRDEQVTFVDPLSGKEVIPVMEFVRRYWFTGFHMSVQ